MNECTRARSILEVDQFVARQAHHVRIAIAGALRSNSHTVRSGCDHIEYITYIYL